VRKNIIVLCFALFVILPASVLVNGLRGCAIKIDKYISGERLPSIYPDYSSTIIPPNIAPLNFMVQEKGNEYFVRIYSAKGEPIEVCSRSTKIMIPPGSWHELLGKNKGGEVNLDIFVKTADAGWVKFNTITNKIAAEDIDGYLAYRRMHPTHTHTIGRLGIYQRNLGNFDESIIFDNRGTTNQCVNCHTFCENRPDKMLMGIRGDKQAKTVLIDGPTVSKLDAKFGYTSWHPSGKLAVYSINNLPMFFHTARNEVRDTFDIDSDLACFDVNSKTLKMPAEISKKDVLENWPCWSADGRYLYFCVTPKIPVNQFPPSGYEKVKYDLVRISYDIEQDKWGETETVLSAKDTGLSISMPRVSPDGRWLLFCMSEYGYFPTWQQSSDLYIMDLKSAEATGPSTPLRAGRYEYRRLDISSDQSESWHGWSSNSRWIVFSSKRDQGAFTRCYLSYVDENGRAYKPLVLPQKDPEYYDYCLETFNTPAFVTGPILFSRDKLIQLANSHNEISLKKPITTVTPKSNEYQQMGKNRERE
jgi:hypothetical protein